MKTKFKTLAAVTALLLMGTTNTNASADHRRFFDNAFVVEQETSLTVEEWMIDEDFWTPKETIENETLLQVENETSLLVEPWMINEDFWTPKATSENVENETPLRVESWMTNESVWK